MEHSALVLQIIIGIGTIVGVFIGIKLGITKLEQDLKDFKEHAGLRMESHAFAIDKINDGQKQHILDWHK